MRIRLVVLALSAFASAALATEARAGSSDEEKIGKVARKYAISELEVFATKFKPKAICHCHTAPWQRKVGILVTTNGLDLLCAIPTTIANGELSVVDYGCVDFDIIGK